MLPVDEERAEPVRWIFAKFSAVGSGTELAREVAQRCIGTARGNRVDKKYLYRNLNNRAVVGESVHKGDRYPGERVANTDRHTGDCVHATLRENPRCP